MIDKFEFFEKYRVDKKDFKSTGISWEDLVGIYNDYVDTRSDLEPTGTYIAQRLRKLNAVHSLRIRLKDPEHLIEKIIRKKIEDNSVDINQQNYRDKVTDLIGVRALHLFKEDWALIHDFITDNWDFHETATANVRKGDPQDFIDRFEKKDCAINYHEFGYRSVHYIVKSQPATAKNPHLAEIQVRTIFEEGFSEIDHQIRYPYDLDNNNILGYFLAIFNRLAGSADEMGSFVKILKHELSKNAREKEQRTEKIKEQVEKLKIERTEKEKLQKDLDRLSSIKLTFTEQTTMPIISDTFNSTVIPFIDEIAVKAPSLPFYKSGFPPKAPAVNEDQQLVKSKRKEKKKPNRKGKT